MKKFSKRLLSLVLVITLALSLSACSTKKGATSDEKSIPATKVNAVSKTTVFVTPNWVKSVIDGQQPESKNFVVLEASWGKVEDSPDYKKGHIPGALHIDISSIETEPYWNLKTPEEVEKVFLDLGITKDTTVILYGLDAGAPRVAYAAIWAGVENVKLINGGLAAWTTAGYKLSTETTDPKIAKYFGTKVPAHPEYWLSIEDTEKKLENEPNFRLISIRTKDEYEGKTSGYNYIPKAGEPKGAIWGHSGSSADTMEDYLHADGTYITISEAQKLWEGYDISKDNELAFYCGTGWRATVPFLLCYEAGYKNIKLYDGGWYQWQMNDNLPVQVGDPKSKNVVYTTVGNLSKDKAKKS